MDDMASTSLLGSDRRVARRGMKDSFTDASLKSRAMRLRYARVGRSPMYRSLIRTTTPITARAIGRRRPKTGKPTSVTKLASRLRNSHNFERYVCSRSFGTEARVTAIRKTPAMAQSVDSSRDRCCLKNRNAIQLAARKAAHGTIATTRSARRNAMRRIASTKGPKNQTMNAAR
jgi:hypothetical protein